VTPRRLSIAALLALGAWLVPGAVAQRPPNVVGTLVRTATASAPCPSGEPCDPPATAVVLSFRRGGRVAASVLVRRAFRLRLAPGRYTIAARSPAAPRTAPAGSPVAPAGAVLRPSTLRVPRHGVVHPHLRLAAVR
jgi:hypothetical protein